MAGSLNHLVGNNDEFTIETIENMGDAHEALAECYKIIFYLAGEKKKRISRACRALNFPDPWDKTYDDETHP